MLGLREASTSNEEWREKSRPFGEIRRALEPLEWKAEENGVLFVPIELPVKAEYDAVLEAVVTRLQEVSELISAAGGATSKHPKK